MWIKIKKIFIHENAFENVVWSMAAILSRGRWFKEIEKEDDQAYAIHNSHGC